ncbi:MAG: glycosyltransferase, partial [Spirochaetaceae bacterium]
MKRLALVGDYVPRPCGIAEFGHDLVTAVRRRHPDVDAQVVAVNDVPEGYDYPPEVAFEIPEERSAAYEQAAEYLHALDVDVVSLQHEYGIYGGPAGRHILALLKTIRVPVVTTLHTILERPSPEQRKVLTELAGSSMYVVTMSYKGEQMLKEVYGVPADQIAVIPHGVPDMPFVDPNFYKDQFGVEGKCVILTFGLLSPNKGIEIMIEALPEVIREVPNVVYIVVGATHPHLRRSEGETYRLSLERLAERLGVKDHVVFYNRFVSEEELGEFLGAADIYVTPYLNEAQITSGTLAYALGCGKAVVSTPYWHAAELLAEDRGILVPFRDPSATARAILDLITDEPRRHAMRKRAYLLGREMTWPGVGEQYFRLFRRARERRAWAGFGRRLIVRTLSESPRQLPQPRLEHLQRLTDDVGVLQHATFAVPNRREGYCTDDLARALIVSFSLGDTSQADRRVLESVGLSAAAFIDHAFDAETSQFRNFMDYDRRWLDSQGSPDSQGRAMWALGTVVARSDSEALVAWATTLFERALPVVAEFTPVRTRAFLALGLGEYLSHFPGNRLARQTADDVLSGLVAQYEAGATADWNWFEDELTYDNARMPEALLRIGEALDDTRAKDIGISTLQWLQEVQSAPDGHLRPIGNQGFYRRGKERAVFDQQPVDAAATVSACVAAFDVTGEPVWRDEAHRSFEWFLGRNDLGISLLEPVSGGCFDGLSIDRVNRNMGAESTLSFLLALGHLRTLEGRIVSYGPRAARSGT